MTATTWAEAALLCLLVVGVLAAVKAVDVVARARLRRALERVQSAEEVRRQRRVATRRLAAIFADDELACGASRPPPAATGGRAVRRLP